MLNELLAFFKSLLKIFEILRIFNVFHDILLEFAHFPLKAQEEFSYHGSNLLLNQLRVCLLHVTHARSVLFIFECEATLQLFDDQCCELESLHLLLEDGLIRKELLGLLVICAVWLVKHGITLGRRQLLNDWGLMLELLLQYLHLWPWLLNLLRQHLSLLHLLLHLLL